MSIQLPTKDSVLKKNHKKFRYKILNKFELQGIFLMKEPCPLMPAMPISC